MYPTEEMSMDVSEMHPVFLYASSQNDYIHQNLPEHVVPSLQKKTPQNQHTMQRPKYTNSPPPATQNHRKNNPRYTPPLTYGFQPKPPTHRQINVQQPQKKAQPNQQYDRFRGGWPQETIYQTSVRHKNQPQNKQFSQNIQLQAAAHQNRQNTVQSPHYQTTVADLPVSFDYLSHILSHENQQFNTYAPNHKKPALNYQERHHSTGVNRKSNNHGQRNQKPRENHRQEVVRKPATFEETAHSFKNRFNNQANEGHFPSTASNNYNGPTTQDRHPSFTNERLNMQNHARSMRGENKPQLAPRPSFSNGGIKINTLAGELPILHLDSTAVANENPSYYLQNNNRHDHLSVDEQEKKTYLLIKAPPLVTTERPLSAPYIAETLKQTSAPYTVNNFDETSLRVPEITYSTPSETHTSPNNNDSPAIVLDLVQIPDHAAYSEQEKHFTQSHLQPEFRAAVEKQEIIENVHPTESYSTTPMYTFEHLMRTINKGYSPSSEGNFKHQSKAFSKPKVKELKKAANYTSLMHPISYSSSVSVVSVKQSVDTKPSTSKKQKATVKKTSYKKAKIPTYDDYMYDDYDGDQNVPGEAGRDYPIHKDIPTTSFQCSSNKSPGFYADTETGCQVIFKF